MITLIVPLKLNILEGYLVEGQVLTVEDMHDGMILTSVSGYPLTIHLDPLRLNNATLSTIQQEFCRNGVIHRLTHYTYPLMPWLEKSTYDVLLETNRLRKGDLSNFIALLNASTEWKIQLEQGPEGNCGTTLFVPTNEALGGTLALGTFLANASSAITTQRFLEHHFVNGINFAVRSWWKTVPTANQVSANELRLETQAGGPMLKLQIDSDDVVTINGIATIVQPDLFSRYGVMHVIDVPLVVLT